MAQNQSMRIIVKRNRYVALTKQIAKRADTVARKAAFDMQALAQAMAPVDTGYLKGSIGARPAMDGWVVLAAAEYAAFVEYGTSRMAAQPYFTPAFEAVRGSFLAAMKQTGAYLG